jgi:uncharacterized protein YacL
VSHGDILSPQLINTNQTINQTKTIMEKVGEVFMFILSTFFIISMLVLFDWVAEHESVLFAVGMLTLAFAIFGFVVAYLAMKYVFRKKNKK